MGRATCAVHSSEPRHFFAKVCSFEKFFFTDFKNTAYPYQGLQLAVRTNSSFQMTLPWVSGWTTRQPRIQIVFDRTS